MLHGPIWNKIPRFALPVAATAIPEQLFNASDITVVGNFTGAERTAAVAAVGASSSIIGLIVNLFIGIALGANVVIAHAIGHGGRETVTKAVHTSILVSVLGGTMVALLYRQLHRPAMDTSIWSQSSFVSTSRSCGAFCVLACRPASSAAFNIEIITYDILNAFSQACTTFVGQNFCAGELGRCKRTLALCLTEGIITLAAAIAVILFFGKQLPAIFNSDPKVVSTGYIRLVMVMLSHSFSLLYDVMSGYLRGFGISLAPALLTILGVCGIRIAWIQFVFPQSRTFQTIMAAYPISLSVTALLIFAALLYYRRPGGLPCRKKANVPPTPGLRKGPCFALCTP